MSIPHNFEVEVGLVHLLKRANLPPKVFAENHVINTQVAEVVTAEDLLGWGFTQEECASFFKWLKRWQKMRDHIISQNLWDEMKDEIERTGIGSCEQLKHALGSASLQCSAKERLNKSLSCELKYREQGNDFSGT